jgi:hypothetical protein
LTYCYNSHVVLIMDAYVYNKFCKSRSWFALGQANDLKEAHVGKGLIFTNHVDKASIMKREVMPKELQDKSSTSPSPVTDVVVFINFRACSEVYKLRKWDIQKLHKVSIPSHQEPMNLKTHASSYGESIERCTFWNFRTDFIAEVKRT